MTVMGGPVHRGGQKRPPDPPRASRERSPGLGGFPFVDHRWFGVYAHVPFCLSRCHYCDFVTYTGMEGLRRPYAAALLEEAGLAVAAWRDAPFFTDAERAALALTESVTRLADTADPVPDSVWDEAARHYDEQELAALVLSIATVNVWNRLNVATRQVAGQEW